MCYVINMNSKGLIVALLYVSVSLCLNILSCKSFMGLIYYKLQKQGKGEYTEYALCTRKHDQIQLLKNMLLCKD